MRSVVDLEGARSFESVFRNARSRDEKGDTIPSLGVSP